MIHTHFLFWSLIRRLQVHIYTLILSRETLKETHKRQQEQQHTHTSAQSELMRTLTKPSSPGAYLQSAVAPSPLPQVHPPPPLFPPSPLEHSLTSVIKMKQVSQSRSGERMWQAGNGQDKEEIYEVLVNLNNSLNERARESPNQPPVSGSHPSPDVLWISLSLSQRLLTVKKTRRIQTDLHWQYHLGCFFLSSLDPAIDSNPREV